MTDWSVIQADGAWNEGRIQDWILDYLQTPEWANLGLARRIELYGDSWERPVLRPISDFVIMAGPTEEYVYPKDAGQWSQAIARMVTPDLSPDDFPPILAHPDPRRGLTVADGNHRIAALLGNGHDRVWALVHRGPLLSAEEIAKPVAKLGVRILPPR